MIRRVLAQLHLWTGLVLFLPLVLLGVTGSILVFEDELHAAFAPASPAVQGEPRSIGEIVGAALRAAPADYVPASYVAPAGPAGLAAVRLSPARRGAAASERVRIDVDPVLLQTFSDAESGFLRQVFFLHSTLLLRNREGRQLVGWLGVAMLVMAVSGLVNWWPRRRRWRAAFIVNPRAKGYRLHREVHGAVGIWGFAVLTAVSFAGVYLAFPESVRGAVDLLLPARDLRAAAAGLRIEPIAGVERAGIDDAVALARSRFPDAALRFVFLPARPEQPFRIGLARPGAERGTPVLTVFIDPGARRIVETFDPATFSTGERVLAWQHAVHAGRGFGPVWRLLVFVCGLLPLLFSVTGIIMWRLRRRRRAAAADHQNPIIDQAYTARRAGE
jgi:uncharacterized iron-regulated membrane protein